MQVHFEEHSLKEVLNYFAEDFELEDCEKVLDVFVDAAQGKVIFKLLVKEEK
jgi:hypothetical protein